MDVSDRKLRKEIEKAQKKEKFLQKAKFSNVTDKKRDIKEVIQIKSETPIGEKKNTERELPKAYCPLFTEEGWFAWWEKQGYFRPEYNEKKTNEKFVIMIPPPNVTGILHIGHALTLSIEDCIVRWHRMQGKQTLWLPGTDHAGIATQAVVEKKIMRENGLTRHDLGREKFIDEVWKWKNEKGDRIIEQLKKMGSSCDFSRLRFTMEESMCAAVKEAFVRLFESGAIYRAKRLVHWSCALRSAISDIEVNNIEVRGRTSIIVPGYDRAVDFGQMVRFVYVVKDTNERLEVDTTRIETMLGDTAVAINPSDTKFSHLHGKFVVHPFRDNEAIPIVLDVAVDSAFGTGIVKVTPAHDATDFAIGQRHNLSMPTIFTDDGHIVPGYGQFSGMRRYDARIAVIESLKQLGLFVSIHDHNNVLPMCSKSKDVIEPMIKEQWYLKCKEPASKALEAVETKKLRLLPENTHDKVWKSWMSDCHDWCISRQLWWGHRIPAYRVVSHDATEETWVAARSEQEAITAAAKKLDVSEADVRVTQDEDVLDTWFSSQLFPFATLGWPQETADLEKYYPGDLLETGHDILFFWVARMVMIGLTMTEKLPFETVYLHAMIRDAHGRKMSKSLGNVLDPYDIIHGISLADLQRALESGNLDPRELDRAKASQAKDFPNGIPQCGTDALRFALLAYTTQPRDINLDVLRISGYRNFCNKIWQAFRYCEKYGAIDSLAASVDLGALCGSLAATDRWILSRLAHAVTEVNLALQAYNFLAATTAVHRFWVHELCDVYVEYSKTHRGGARQTTVQAVLFECLDVGLRLLHPMMPFITEELYQRLPRRSDHDEESICVARYPVGADFGALKVAAGDDDKEEQEDMVVALELLRKVRAYRKDAGLLDKAEMRVRVRVLEVDFCQRYLDDVILPLSRSREDNEVHDDDARLVVRDLRLEIWHVLTRIEVPMNNNELSHTNTTMHTDSLTHTDALVNNNELSHTNTLAHFFTVRCSAETVARVSASLVKLADHPLNDLEVILVKQWTSWLSQQSLRGRAARKDTLYFVDSHLIKNTYIAGTKFPSVADGWLLLYLSENDLLNGLAAGSPNVHRWHLAMAALI